VKDSFYVSNLINRILKRYNYILNPVFYIKNEIIDIKDFKFGEISEIIPQCKIQLQPNQQKKYIDRNIEYTSDGRLIDENGYSIMMDWEKPIMEFQAAQITKNGGDILNVGFGMGFMDEAIQKFNINSHTIIEIHPRVIAEMKKRGWNKKNNVNILHGDWRDFLFKLPKFDGIYIDIWDDDQQDFIAYAPNLLKENGILTFFNNPTEDKDNDGLPDGHKNIIERNFNVEFFNFEIPWIDDSSRQAKNCQPYWRKEWKIYKSPLLTLKNK
jgi:protein-L-isoaspartate O-methyltransferase